MALRIEEFGHIKKASTGFDYLYTPNCNIGIRADRVIAIRGKVKSINAIFQYWQIEVEGLDEKFLIHNNWVKDFGPINIGEEIEGIIDVKHYFGWVAWYIRRCFSKEGIKIGI
jgi:hypothetical protein